MTLELRFLGEMEVVKGGERVELPPSKKTRALLAYLVLTGRAHRRDRLCQLLWEDADDPKGALRWSLSRLRVVVDEPGLARIAGSRERVSFEAHGARVDIVELKRLLAAGLSGAPLAELEAWARGFRGELLEGLGLEDLLELQAWCLAEREEARRLRAALLRALVARLEKDPAAALPHARDLVVVEPLDRSANASLVRLLGAAGRLAEAEQHYESVRRLDAELGRPPAPDVEEAWRAARAGGTARAAVSAPPPPAAPAEAVLVGRRDEKARLVRLLAETVRDRRLHAVLLTGEPGIGKTRLLEELCRSARAQGATVLEGPAFEAEAGRPFAPWLEILRQLPPEALARAGGELSTLLPELSPAGAPPTRDRVFTAVVELLSERAASAPPLVLALDDVHWLDSASAELLHAVARLGRPLPILLLLAARAGELYDNEAVQRTLRGLRELRLLEEMRLRPLNVEETRDLVEETAPGANVRALHAESGGNPLLALEMARALAEPRPEPRAEPGTVTGLVRGRVERLSPEAVDVLRWSALFERGIDVARLGALMALPLDRLLGALTLLERHALLRVREGSGRGNYDFAHEVVRRAVSSELTQPRRRLMHRRIAEHLETAESRDATAAELAHHAALAGEHALAAEACVRAGRLFLRQCANEEAWAMARRGRKHAAEVDEPRRSALLAEVQQVELQARPDPAAKHERPPNV